MNDIVEVRKAREGYRVAFGGNGCSVTYRTRERALYALRNEHNVPTVQCETMLRIVDSKGRWPETDRRAQ